MFTGIIKKTSKVENTLPQKGGLFLEISKNLTKIKKGDSLNINGVCSTIKGLNKNILFEYMPETLRLSNLGLLKKGDIVNLEQSLSLNDKLDGHIVLGHIDGGGKILSIKKEGNSKAFEIKVSQRFVKFLVYKGSIAIEGISLTITKVFKDSFIVKILPYTFQHTNLQYKRVGDVINLEFDILAKYANKK
jgi:riboflavin synthase